MCWGFVLGPCFCYAVLRAFPSFTIIDSHFYINKIFERKIDKFSDPSVLTYVLGAQKNRLIETVLLSIHTICFS